VKGNSKSIKSLIDHEDDEIYASAITYAELMYGIEKKNSPRLSDDVRQIAGKLFIADFDIDAAEHYSRIRCSLEKDGMSLANMDMMIAATAMSVGAILITHNTKHFSKIKGLKVEDWS
jgi:tRNA(fMet)-specific endonuclease VapC